MINRRPARTARFHQMKRLSSLNAMLVLSVFEHARSHLFGPPGFQHHVLGEIPAHFLKERTLMDLSRPRQGIGECRRGQALVYDPSVGCDSRSFEFPLKRRGFVYGSRFGKRHNKNM